MKNQTHINHALFITFEGIDGSGKSTQASMLREYLNGNNTEAVLTREIGGTKVGNIIRELVINTQDLNPISELLLSMAARSEHIEKFIRVNLDRGATVISDRFVDTTAVYRALSGKITHETVYNLHVQFFGEMWPDVTFVLDTDFLTTQKHLQSRSDNNRFDSINFDLYTKKRQGFIACQQLYPERIHIIDGNRAVEIIHQDITNILTAKYIAIAPLV